MKVHHTKHLIERLQLRQIDAELPATIYQQATERYIDIDTGYHVAVMDALLYGKMRHVMVAYVSEGDEIRLLTIHPLKDGQKDNRLASGRWRKA